LRGWHARAGALACLPFLFASCGSPQLVEPTEPRLEPRLEARHARMADGFQLPLGAQGPLDAEVVVLALHGFNDYGNAFARLAERLAAEGMRVYTPDQRGFGAGLLAGRWHGSSRLIDDLRALVAAIRTRHPSSRVILVGESMGGAVVLAALADKPIPADGLVLIAPAVWDRESMPWYQRAALAAAVRLAPGKVLTGEGVPIYPSNNIPMLRAMGADPLVLKGARVDALWGVTNLMDRARDGVAHLRGPALLLYGERDRIIPPTAFCRMLALLPAPTSASASPSIATAGTCSPGTAKATAYATTSPDGSTTPPPRSAPAKRPPSTASACRPFAGSMKTRSPSALGRPTADALTRTGSQLHSTPTTERLRYTRRWTIAVVDGLSGTVTRAVGGLR
jgi:acylglycerol lipase